MKKNICLFFILLSTISIFATDIRQVMFGNNYETIQEVDSSQIFDEYPDVKTYMDTLNISEFKWKDSELNNGVQKRYYRTFEQTIGNEKFIRVVKGACELTDEFILNWRNPYKRAVEGHSYITQLFYIAEDEIYAIGNFTVMEADGYTWENGTKLKYEMVEIIQRNGNIKGFLFNYLEDRIDHHNRAEENGVYEEVYANTAEYYRFEDIIENASEKCGNVKYARTYEDSQYVLIEASQPLVDSKRPFMYTINNAFDGNTGTAYVENTDDDEFLIKFEFGNDSKFAFGNTFKLGNTVKINKLRIINGYAKTNDLYINNNRIKKFYFHSLSIETHGKNKEEIYDKLWSSENIVFPNSLDYYEVQLEPIEYYSLTFGIREIEKGRKYNDTCLAEIDFNIENMGYIFGE
jgi:hypothetical protein